MGFFRFLGKVIAFLLLIAFIVVLPALLWTYNIQSVLFDRSTYANISQNRSMYTTLLPAALPRFVDDMAARSPSDEARYTAGLFDNLGSAEWQEIANLLFPVDWIQEQIDRNAEALFAWIDGPDVLPAFVVDLGEPKSRMAGPEGEQATELVVGTWPICTPEQAQVVEAVLDEEADVEDMPACQPDDAALRTRLLDAISEGLTTTADATPDSLMADESQLSLQQSQQWLNLKVYLRVARRTSYLVFVLPAALLLLILILAVRSFKSLLRWYGWGLLLGGLLGLLVLVPVSFSPLLAWQLASGSQEVEITLLPALLALAGIMSQITRPILIQSGAAAAVGFVMLGLASLIRDKVEPETPPAA